MGRITNAHLHKHGSSTKPKQSLRYRYNHLARKGSFIPFLDHRTVKSVGLLRLLKIAGGKRGVWSVFVL